MTGEPASYQPRTYINAKRTIMVKVLRNGTVKVAYRIGPNNQWGEPVTLKEEK